MPYDPIQILKKHHGQKTETLEMILPVPGKTGAGKISVFFNVFCSRLKCEDRYVMQHTCQANGEISLEANDRIPEYL